ncbi:hypothetical protein [Ulvibacterium marinum]|uniref:RND transporter n=1 Tax=Ulvibacterium marinum TaxID=2419782 RepID=A0A3B0BXW4_9FLAO|nr:hypothetical protein [Ulvibacterium marinum]RKN78355.1 hypothetical protein D7Z94_19200 [Ulvibacterium marinum]
MLRDFINNGKIVLFLCLTLGLAPYFPEPHILGKIKWLLGGGIGMRAMDWFDVLLHGFPFVLLFRWIILRFKKSRIP